MTARDCTRARMGAQLAHDRLSTRRSQVGGAEKENRLRSLQLKREDAGRRQVLDRVEAAIALGVVAEVPVPIRLMAVGAVGARMDLGHTVVGTP